MITKAQRMAFLRERTGLGSDNEVESSALALFEAIVDEMADASKGGLVQVMGSYSTTQVVLPKEWPAIRNQLEASGARQLHPRWEEWGVREHGYLVDMWSRRNLLDYMKSRKLTAADDVPDEELQRLVCDDFHALVNEGKCAQAYFEPSEYGWRLGGVLVFPDHTRGEGEESDGH